MDLSIFSFALFLLCFVNFQETVVAQSLALRGAVYTDVDEPLPFVFIIPDEQTHLGKLTRFNGKFEFGSEKPIKKLTLFHPDYKTESIEIGNPKEPLHIRLNYLPDEMVIKENLNSEKVLAIVQNIIALEEESVIYKNHQFKYEAYNKIKGELFISDETYKEKENLGKRDLKYLNYYKEQRDNYLFLIESYTEREFKKVKRDKENILKARSSGIEDGLVLSFLSSFKPITLYEKYINFSGNRVNCPLNKDNLRKYNFVLRSMKNFLENEIYIIDFFPIKKFDSNPSDYLFGTIYIDVSSFKLLAFYVQNHNELDGKEVEIIQKNSFIKKDTIFPTHVFLKIKLPEFPTKYVGTTFVKNSYISKIDLNPKFENLKEKLRFDMVVFDNYNDSTENAFWDIKRKDSLSKKEELTYINSFNDTDDRVIKKWYKLGKAFYKDELAVDFLGINLNNLFSLNQYEGLRLGMGLSTTEKISKTFAIGGYGAYGFRDKQWKFGGNFNYYIKKSRENYFQVKTLYDLEEPGSQHYFGQKDDFFRRIMTRRMDKYRFNGISFYNGFINNTNAEISLNSYWKEPTYDYIYAPEANSDSLSSPQKFKSTDITIKLRYSIDGNFYIGKRQLMTFGKTFPVLYMNFTRGIKGLFGGNYNYSKLSYKVDHSFFIGNYGKSDVTFEYGLMDSDLPYPMLFNGRGGKSTLSGIIVKDVFQTMDIYGFVSDNYFNIYYQHNFGSLLFNSGRFRPEFGVALNAGWGQFNLDNPKEIHQKIEISDYSRGYYETGILINNLLKAKILGLVKGGLGIGMFYNFGFYAKPNVHNNLAFRITYLVNGI
ncbi:MAG: hypothetical protein KTR26_12915 [Flammeovirgaceae bacterium]|nr:hypothetical protein [Flammeovirgaceae bacterium]